MLQPLGRLMNGRRAHEYRRETVATWTEAEIRMRALRLANGTLRVYGVQAADGRSITIVIEPRKRGRQL